MTPTVFPFNSVPNKPCLVDKSRTCLSPQTIFRKTEIINPIDNSATESVEYPEALQTTILFSLHTLISI